MRRGPTHPDPREADHDVTSYHRLIGRSENKIKNCFSAIKRAKSINLHSCRAIAGKGEFPIADKSRSRETGCRIRSAGTLVRSLQAPGRERCGWDVHMRRGKRSRRLLSCREKAAAGG